MHLSIAKKLDAKSNLRYRIDKNLRDMREQSDMKIVSQSRRTNKSFCCRTTTPSSYRSLRNHKPSLFLSIDVTILVTHFDSRLDKCCSKWSVIRCFSNGQISAC